MLHILFLEFVFFEMFDAFCNYIMMTMCDMPIKIEQSSAFVFVLFLVFIAFCFAFYLFFMLHFEQPFLLMLRRRRGRRPIFVSNTQYSPFSNDPESHNS